MIYLCSMHNCDCVKSSISLPIAKAIFSNSPVSCAAKTKKHIFFILSISSKNWIHFFCFCFYIHKFLAAHCVWQFKWFENVVNFAISMWTWTNLNKCETSGNRNRLAEADFVAVTYRSWVEKKILARHKTKMRMREKKIQQKPQTHSTWRGREWKREIWKGGRKKRKSFFVS